jgi:small redox-active disulfide protein 2
MNTIKVYGTGCKNCIKLEETAREAVEELKADFAIEKVSDMEAIVKRGIMRTPGLEINGKIVSMGQIPTKWTLMHWIEESFKAENAG